MNLNNLNSITKDLYDSTSENVVSVGYGKKKKNGIITSENSLIFGVLEKKPIYEIPTDELIPKIINIDGENITTDVIEWKVPSLLVDCPPSFYDWMTTPPPNRGLVRPLVGGLSITNYTSLSGYAGTMGFVAVDNQTNSLVGVTNSHVIIDDAFLDSLRTINSVATNVADDSVTQPSSGEAGYLGQNNSVGVVKRYYPLVGPSGTNLIDAAIFTLNESDINTGTSYQQLGLTYNQPLEFATSTEIANLVISGTPLYSTGRTTGAKGEGDMKLIPYIVALTTSVVGNTKQGVSTNTTFSDCIAFVASATTTPSSQVCLYPIAAGDSGSVLIGDFGGVRKIVGLNFAGSDTVGVANYITNVSSLLDISPYTGQSVNYSDTGNTQYHLVAGKSSDINLNISGDVFWQVGLDICNFVTPTSTPTNTPTPTITPTSSETPTPTPTPTSGVTTDGWLFYYSEGPLSVGPPDSDGNILFMYPLLDIITYSPNYTGGTFELYFNENDSNGTSYLSQFQGLDTNGGTLTISQGDNTAIYSGNSVQYLLEPSLGFLRLDVGNESQMIQSASTPFVSGTTINVVVN